MSYFFRYQNLLLQATFIFFTFSSHAQMHGWQKTSPGGGGAFNVVKAGPTGIILVGSDLSGVYKSKDQGQTFSTLGARQGLTLGHIGGLGFDPVNASKFM